MSLTTIQEQALEAGRQIQEAQEEQAHKERILAEMAAYINRRVDQNSPVMYHDEPKNKISLPNGMTLDRASQITQSEAKAQIQKTQTVRNINCRVEDGLVAMHRVMNRVFGSQGKGITHYSLFGGVHPPTRMNVTVGLTATGRKKTESVPASEIEFSWLDATIDVDTWSSPEDPALLRLSVTHLVRNQDSVDGFLAMVEDEVAAHSIYKGQILQYKGEARGAYSLEFVHRVSDPTIVYNQDTQGQLDMGVLGVMRNSGLLQEAGQQTSFKALFWGPLGTGKSEACVTTALVAKQCGRTVIEYKPTSGDSIDEFIRVFNVARRYGPSVVYIEDFDRFFEGQVTDKAISTLTNLFDGADKDDNISVMMTTNHIENIDAKMTRAQRLTAPIYFGPLDRDAIERMMYASIGEQLEDHIDFERVYQAVHDFSPAFIKSTYKQARTASILRNHRLDVKLGTEDLVNAANGKRSQVDLHNRMANEEKPEPTLWDVLASGLLKVLDRTHDRMKLQMYGSYVDGSEARFEIKL